MELKEIIENKISELSKDNLSLKASNEEMAKKNEKKIDEIFSEFLTVIDTFERSEQTIKERGLDSDENAVRAIKRLLNAKRKALFVLEKYNVKQITFENNIAIDELCVTNGTEPDAAKQNGEIISIEKNGFTRDGHLIRPAEVIVVKN